MVIQKPPAADNDGRRQLPAVHEPLVAYLRDDVDERRHLLQTPHILVCRSPCECDVKNSWAPWVLPGAWVRVAFLRDTDGADDGSRRRVRQVFCAVRHPERHRKHTTDDIKSGVEQAISPPSLVSGLHAGRVWSPSRGIQSFTLWSWRLLPTGILTSAGNQHDVGGDRRGGTRGDHAALGDNRPAVHRIDATSCQMESNVLSATCVPRCPFRRSSAIFIPEDRNYMEFIHRQPNW